MLSPLFIFVTLCILTNAEEIHKKLCANVDSSQCAVHSASVEPCLHSPRFCSFIKDKRYSINVNFTPYFSAHNLKVAVSSDTLDLGTLTPLRTYKDACRSLVTCPLEAHVRQSFDLPLTFDTKGQGKFPVQIKWWNAENETQVCCFTFKAKLK